MTKEEILAELAASREAIVQGWSALRAELDFKTKLSNLVREKPYAWLGGALALGWILAGPKSKTRVETKTITPIVKVEKKKARAGLVALILGLVRLLLPVLKPAATAYVGGRIADLAKRPSK
jgi:TctA family transporter